MFPYSQDSFPGPSTHPDPKPDFRPKSAAGRPMTARGRPMTARGRRDPVSHVELQLKIGDITQDQVAHSVLVLIANRFILLFTNAIL